MKLYEATVTNVRNERGIILLSVQLNNGDSRSNVAFGKLSSDFITTPNEGDVVTIQETDQENWVATNIISRTKNKSPETGEGEMAFQLDENNVIKATKTDTGYDITIEAEGAITIDSASEIIVGKDGVPVAKQNHTHDFEYSWGSESGSGSGTTSNPNESGTTTKIE